jgi:Ser/Thr protein kinase RdoA (MazF antagonist)
MISDGRLDTALAESWGIRDARIEPHHGGMNSATWFVDADAARWVAKAVAPREGRQFAAGLAVAARLDQAGIASGAPLPTRDGSLAAAVDGVPLALLARVPGEPLTDRPEHQSRCGATLGRVHRALRGIDVEDTKHFHWVDPEAAHLDVRPWVRAAVAAAVEAFDALGPATLTYGYLHTDPAPEAFLFDERTGDCGLIDWSTALSGPLLYDLASAAMYVGGPERARRLVDAYAAQGALPRDEIERGLKAMLCFRWGVQADYFARRIATGDLTGIADAAGNEKGLEDARRALGA